jgi:hypothetical protein
MLLLCGRCVLLLLIACSFLTNNKKKSIALTDTQNHDVPFTIDDNQDGTFTIAYTPKSPGVHCISVLFGENEIPISPLKVNVEPTVDINKIRIEGLETSKYFPLKMILI